MQIDLGPLRDRILLRQGDPQRIAAFDVLHHHQAQVLALDFSATGLHHAHNFGMIKAGDGTGFSQEAHDKALVTGQMGRQHFDGDVNVEIFVAGQLHFAHAALAELTKDLQAVEVATSEIDGRAYRRVNRGIDSRIRGCVDGQSILGIQIYAGQSKVKVIVCASSHGSSLVHRHMGRTAFVSAGMCTGEWPECVSRSELGYAPPSGREAVTHSAPTGTVTLVFTDIQGSTDLWESIGEAFHDTLELHNALFREAIAEFDGYEVKTEGDAFMIAFSDPVKALDCCLALQDRLHAADWTELVLHSPQAGESEDKLFRGVRVRMGLHCGEPICQPDSATGRMDYFGPMVNRAARIGGCAHGGQVVVGESVWKSVEGSISDATTLDLGEHRLKGLEAPEKIWQVLPASLSERVFPPLRTLDPKRTNLPRRLSSFVGREGEISELSELLCFQETHLVTMHGPGGTGKTRLALRIGAELLSEFPAGVWFADGSEATSEAGLCSALAKALSIPLTQADAVKQIGDALAGRSHGKGQLLLILDNTEQVTGIAASVIAQWMQAAPDVTFLVTSRELLNIEGEQEYRLEPLPLPQAGKGPYVNHEVSRHTAKLEAYASVKLFLDRAHSVNPRFKADREGLEAICEICCLLDGIPLAIELAASRSKLLAPVKLLAKLHKDGNAALKSSRRDVSNRQATLDSAIEWSWQLLNDEEQQALCRLALFRGGFFLDHTEELIEDADEYVASLLDKSLIRSYEVESLGETRYGMYRSIQEFVLARAPSVVDIEEATQAWASTVVGYAEQWNEEVQGPDAAEALNRLECELDNVFALQDALEKRDAELVARALLAIAAVLKIRGPWGERIPRLQRALAGLSDSSDLSLQIRVANALTIAAHNSGTPVQLQSAADQTVSLVAQLDQQADADHLRLLGAQAQFASLMRHGEAAKAGELIDEALRAQGYKIEGLSSAASAFPRSQRADIALCATQRGVSHMVQGEYDQALVCFDEVESIYRKHGHAYELATVIGNRGVLFTFRQDNEAAIACYTETEAMNRSLGNKLGLCDSQGNLGTALMNVARFDEALKLIVAAEEAQRELGNLRGASVMISNRGIVYRERGELGAAIDCFLEAENICRSLHDGSGVSMHLGNRGEAYRLFGDLEAAEKCLVEAIDMCREQNSKRPLSYWTLSLAQTHLAKNQELASARDLANETLELLEQMGMPASSLHFCALATLGALELQLGNREQAEAKAKQAKAIGEELNIQRLHQELHPKAGIVTEAWQYVDEVLGALE